MRGTARTAPGWCRSPATPCRCSTSGVLAEHLHCRAQAALFDVSHMGQATLTGATAAAALERLVPGDMLGLKPGRQRYTLLTNEAGGIIDDLMVANLGGDRLFLVVNASRKDDDFTHIAANLPAGVQLRPARGPRAAGAARAGRRRGAWRGSRRRPPRCRSWASPPSTLAGIPCLVSRSGYTGEDGFEISVPAEHAEALADRLLAKPEVAPGRPRRARFAAAGGRALPVRQRHRRTDHAGRGRPHLGDRQAPRAGVGLSRRRRDPRPARATAPSATASASAPTAARRPAR